MRYLGLVALAACKGFFDPKPPDAPPMPLSTITYVQGNFNNDTNAVGVSVAFPLTQHGGDLAIVVVEWRGGPQLSAIYDSAANAYAPAVGPAGNASMEQAVFIAPSIVAQLPGQNTVQVTFGGSAAFAEVRIVEYAGLDPASPLDGASTQNGGGTATADSGSVTTMHAHDLLVASATSTSTVNGATSGFNSRLTTSAGNLVEDMEVFDAGTYDAVMTIAGASSWEAQLVALRAAD